MIQCPKCGGGLRKVRWIDGPFWGCVNYPKCNGSLPITASIRSHKDVWKSVVGIAETLQNGEIAKWPRSKIYGELNKRLNRKGLLRNEDLKNFETCKRIEEALCDVCWNEILGGVEKRGKESGEHRKNLSFPALGVRGKRNR